MSAKNKKYKKPANKAALQATDSPIVQAVKKPGKLNIRLTTLHYILLAAVVAVTFYCYHDTPKNEFTNWDDGIYIETDNYIKNLTPENIKMILFHNITDNYYHPLTMLTFAANYHFSKMEPHGYYVTEVCIFLADVIMMFFLALVLFETINLLGYGPIRGSPWLAVICALFYGAHPMHVESAAWIAERKDIMYAFFYFLGIIMYARYSLEKTDKKYLLVFACFILSLLSKPMAVSFPLSLFALDVLLKNDKGLQKKMTDFMVFAGLCMLSVVAAYVLLKAKMAENMLLDIFLLLVFFGLWAVAMRELKKREISRLFLQKFPYIIICVASGISSFVTADKAGSIASSHAFSILTKLFFASHNFMMYILKAFVPAHLCSYYPYPNIDANGFLPFDFYLSPLIDLAIVGIPLYFSYKAGEKYFRMTLFGFSFYFANVIFILQIISAGPAIMADRYTDVAYFGIFFPLTYYGFVLIDKRPSLKVPVATFALVVAGIFAYLCHDRTLVWHNTKTLWGDVIKKYPFQVETSYKNLGNYYADHNQFDSAYDNYIVLVKIHSRDAGVYSNIANIWGLRKQFDTSLAYYTRALKIDSTGKDSYDTYLNRAITYSMMGKYDLALKDYNHAYLKDPNSEKLLENRAYTYLSARQYQNSINDYNKLIQINPDKPMFYFNRGVAESNAGNAQAALSDFLHDLNNDPSNAPNCLYDISVVYSQMKDYKNALDYALKAKQAKYPVGEGYIKDLQDKSMGIKQ